MTTKPLTTHAIAALAVIGTIAATSTITISQSHAASARGAAQCLVLSRGNKAKFTKCLAAYHACKLKNKIKIFGRKRNCRPLG